MTFKSSFQPKLFCDSIKLNSRNPVIFKTFRGPAKHIPHQAFAKTLLILKLVEPRRGEIFPQSLGWVGLCVSHHTLGFLGVCQHLSTALCAWVVVPACVQLLWQQMLQICVHLQISACFHSCVCGSGVPSVRGEGMSRVVMVPCSPVCAAQDAHFQALKGILMAI